MCKTKNLYRSIFYNKTDLGFARWKVTITEQSRADMATRCFSTCNQKGCNKSAAKIFMQCSNQHTHDGDHGHAFSLLVQSYKGPDKFIRNVLSNSMANSTISIAKTRSGYAFSTLLKNTAKNTNKMSKTISRPYEI